MDNVGTFHRSLHLASEVPRSNRDRTVPSAQNSGYIWEPYKKSKYRLISQCNSQNTRPDPAGGAGRNPTEITMACYASICCCYEPDVKYRVDRLAEAFGSNLASSYSGYYAGLSLR